MTGHCWHYPFLTDGTIVNVTQPTPQAQCCWCNSPRYTQRPPTGHGPYIPERDQESVDNGQSYCPARPSSRLAVQPLGETTTE